jgi:hypothetical protein
MSAWEIRLAIPSRDADLVAVGLASRRIEDPEARAVATTIADDAALYGGMRTAGELLDHLAQMTQPQRRKLHNRARVQNGLETVEDVEAHARFEAANETARRRAAARPIPSCVIWGRHPTGPGGMPEEVPPARRWHCAAHEHLAQPDEMEPPPLPISFATMTEHNPDEIEREQREDERRQQEAERRRRDRHAEAEAIRRARERYEEQVAEDDYVRPLIAGIPGVRMDAR